MLSCMFKYQSGDFDLAVKLELHQQILGIVGASGSGKSSVLKNIAGLIRPLQGSIVFDNQVLVDTSQSIFIPAYQRHIALIFQQALLFPHLNVKQNLCYGEKKQSAAQKKLIFDDVVDLLELNDLVNRKAHQLSGGQAQRISIGRALLSAPRLLLLDEPLTGLDQHLKDQVLPFLLRVHTEMKLPMIYVTHHIEELHRLGAEICTLNHGCLATDQPRPMIESKR